MELPKNYNHNEKDDLRYKEWQEKGYFKSQPDEREPYTVLIPPPNVTGVLHMGHMLNNTIQDVLVRRARLLGKNACWVPGTDHASIATEAKVVKKLEAEGIHKADLSRKEFLEHAWEWTHKYGGTIQNQLKKLGASCDWERSRFTLEDDLYNAVIAVFVDLAEKGLIYRGVRMINWDPKAQTALSDEEVIHKEIDSKLFYLSYQIEGSEESITIATTRPETILGDTAVCVHPEDTRFQHLVGKNAIVPLVKRAVPIIADAYVDPEFGTGCLKITPAHDINDNEIGLRYNLPSIDILNDDGTLSEDAQIYVGKDRFDVRKEIIEELKVKGHLMKVEQIQNKLGFSERTDVVIEPKLSLQWFLKMDDISKPALDHVLDDTINFYPKNSVNTYKHWMENIKDWCISRQLWWGHQIPAFYYGSGVNDYVIAKSKDEALPLAQKKSGNNTLTIEEINQDEDVLDTWFSSWLWPISVFDGFTDKDNKDIAYYYPTNDLVTAPDIMFFWVARMIIAGYEYKDLPPFRNVYFTGMVRDDHGRKMSKQLGNSPDPIDLMKKHSADGVRVGMLLSAPAGNDLLFKEQLCEQGRNFSNKLWNALRLLKSWTVSSEEEESEASILADEWFTSIFAKTLVDINANFDEFRISDTLMKTYKLSWDEFCSWYLEMVKPAFEKPIPQKTYEKTVLHFENVLRLVNPYMPFVSEEIWQNLRKREENEHLMVNHWPKSTTFTNEHKIFEEVKQIVTEIRSIRKDKSIPMRDSLQLLVKGEKAEVKRFYPVLERLLNLSEVSMIEDKIENSVGFVVGNIEYYVPLEGMLDVGAEIERINKEIKYLVGFLKSVEKKLSNERFVGNAPEKVVAIERKKQADAEENLNLLKAQLANLSN